MIGPNRDSDVVDARRRDGRAKTVIDVDDCNAGGATIQHRQKSGQAVEGGAVANARRDGDNGHSYQSTDHRRKCPVHSGHDNNDGRAKQFIATRQHAVDSSDADVRESRHAIPESHRGYHGFFGDRQVGGTRRHDENRPGPDRRWLRWSEVRGPAERVQLDGLKSRSEEDRGFGGQARDEQALASFRDARRDLQHLLGRLPFSEHDFGKTLTQGAVVVDRREA